MRQAVSAAGDRLGAPGERPRPVAARPRSEAAGTVLARQARRDSAARAYSRRLPIVLASGRGSIVRDTNGREYVDCLAGAGSLALGHHHPVVTEAIHGALADEVPLATLDMVTPLRDRFVEELFSVLPASLADARIQFCSPSGADAVEAAVKLAKAATGRAGVIAFGGGYHGMTHAAMSISGARAVKEQVGGPWGEVTHLPFPSSYRCPFGVGGDEGARLCARTLEWALGDDHGGVARPAAAVIEAVQGEGGVNPAPAPFATAVRDSTRRHDVPLVVDEVQTGLGRTGRLWASEAVGLEPDVLVLSKAIGGGLPLAVIVHRAELDAWAPGAHAGTFRGNQLAMAAGRATIRHVVREGLAERAEALGAQLMAGLRAVAGDATVVGEVRGRGLMVGVELVDVHAERPDGVPPPDGGLAAAVQRAMLDRGVIVETGGRGGAVVRFLPPLVISARELERVVEAFGGALRAALATRPARP